MWDHCHNFRIDDEIIDDFRDDFKYIRAEPYVDVWFMIEASQVYDSIIADIFQIYKLSMRSSYQKNLTVFTNPNLKGDKILLPQSCSEIVFSDLQNSGSFKKCIFEIKRKSNIL